MQRVTTGIRMQAFQANTQPQYVAYNMPHTLPQTPFMPRPGIVRPTPRWSTQQVQNYCLKNSRSVQLLTNMIMNDILVPQHGSTHPTSPERIHSYDRADPAIQPAPVPTASRTKQPELPVQNERSQPHPPSGKKSLKTSVKLALRKLLRFRRKVFFLWPLKTVFTGFHLNLTKCLN